MIVNNIIEMFKPNINSTFINFYKTTGTSVKNTDNTSIATNAMAITITTVALNTIIHFPPFFLVLLQQYENLQPSQ